MCVCVLVCVRVWVRFWGRFGSILGSILGPILRLILGVNDEHRMNPPSTLVRVADVGRDFYHSLPPGTPLSVR